MSNLRVINKEHASTYSTPVYGGVAVRSSFWLDIFDQDTKTTNRYFFTVRYRGFDALDVQWDVDQVKLPNETNESTLTKEGFEDFITDQYQ